MSVFPILIGVDMSWHLYIRAATAYLSPAARGRRHVSDISGGYGGGPLSQVRDRRRAEERRLEITTVVRRDNTGRAYATAEKGTKEIEKAQEEGTASC